MTTKQKEICNIIETLPDELSSKVLDSPGTSTKC